MVRPHPRRAVRWGFLFGKLSRNCFLAALLLQLRDSLSRHFSMIFLWFSYRSSVVFSWIPDRNSVVFLW